MVAELVRQPNDNFPNVASHIEDSKGYIERKVGRHQEPKGRCPGLDNPPRQGFKSSAFPEYQDNPRLSPPCHGSPSLPSWRRLERCRVNPPSRIPSRVLTRQSRIRAKLVSGEMAVRGDQWPLLVYARQEFDAEEPWDGLFRSELLIWVSTHPSRLVIIHSVVRRPTSIYSPRPAQWRKR